MSERFTAEHFMAFCEAMLGQPYWYGTCVYKCTTATLKAKTKQYPKSYTDARQSKYKRDVASKLVCADCIGGVKGYMWTNGGEGVIESIGTDDTFTSKYGSNGCPDKSANGMFEYAKTKKCDWGVIKTIPEIPGIAVRFDGHVGYYAGDGYVIEWRGYAYGCVKTKLSARPWTHWYKLPFIDYGEEPEPEPEASGAERNVSALPKEKASTAGPEHHLGDRTLRKGMYGTDVKELQEKLIERGYSVGKTGADGDYGTNTMSAVKAFQKKNGLTADGVYGKKTHEKMMGSDDDE